MHIIIQQEHVDLWNNMCTKGLEYYVIRIGALLQVTCQLCLQCIRLGQSRHDFFFFFFFNKSVKYDWPRETYTFIKSGNYYIRKSLCRMERIILEAYYDAFQESNYASARECDHAPTEILNGLFVVTIFSLREDPPLCTVHTRPHIILRKKRKKKRPPAWLHLPSFCVPPMNRAFSGIVANFSQNIPTQVFELR